MKFRKCWTISEKKNDHMAILNISAVLYALGWAILHSFWQMGILWVVYQLFFGLPKKWSPAAKHNSSLLLLFAGFTWFLITGINHYQEYLSVKQYIDILPLANYPEATTILQEENSSFYVAFTDSISGITESSILFLENNIGYISAVYLFILVLMMFRFTHAYIYSNQLKKKGLFPAGHHLDNKITDWTSAMGIRQQVNIYLSELINIPATIGFLKPVILLPVATVNQLSMEQVESIILHELAHISRMDYVWNIAGAVIETILFFNPFVYLLTNVQKKERELCCDDFVLGFSRDPHNYASALLELEKSRIAGKTQLALASNGQEGQLLSRVKRILNIQTNKLQYRQRFLALLFVTTFISALAWLQPAQWKREKQLNTAAALPAPKWMLENQPIQVPTLTELIREQSVFEKEAPKNAIKRTSEKVQKSIKPAIATENAFEVFEKTDLLPEINYRYPVTEIVPFVHMAPYNPAQPNELQEVWNFGAFESINPEMVNELAKLRKGKQVYINAPPPPGWQEHRLEQEFRVQEELAHRNSAEIFLKQQDMEKEFRAISELRNKEFKNLRDIQSFEKLTETLSTDKLKARIKTRASAPNRVYINNKPIGNKVILNKEDAYIIRIETDDESIEISIGTDTLKRKLKMTPVSATTAPLRSTTKRSADTYPRNRY
jgi:beta-lactamase regulating signal transducer with metallopeptidase domain